MGCWVGLVCVVSGLGACTTEPAVPVEPVQSGDDIRYEILVDPQLAGDGLTPNVVRVIATNSDNSPAAGGVVVSVDRADAGSFTATQLALGELGARTAFVGCHAAAAGCLGPAKLSVALAAAPTISVAHADVQIVDPLVLDPAKACRGGGNALHVLGNDAVLTGEVQVGANATWSTSLLDASLATIDVATADDHWQVQLNTTRVQNIPLVPGIYTPVTKALNQTISEQPIGLPAISVSHHGADCDAVDGSFELFDYAVDQNKLGTTFVFEQRCAGSAAGIHGCLHMEMSP